MATLRDGKLTLEPGEAFAVLVVGRKVAGQAPRVDVSIALEDDTTSPSDVKAALAHVLTVVGG